jgi:hypothetical protein
MDSNVQWIYHSPYSPDSKDTYGNGTYNHGPDITFNYNGRNYYGATDGTIYYTGSSSSETTTQFKKRITDEYLKQLHIYSTETNRISYLNTLKYALRALEKSFLNANGGLQIGTVPELNPLNAPSNATLTTEDIKTPELPKIDMGVMPNANDATSVPTPSPLPDVSYSSEPQAFFTQGGLGGNGNGSSGSTMDNIASGLSVAGTASSTYAGLRYTSYNWGGGYFRTACGNFYKMSALELQASGKFVQGVQGLRYGMEVAEKASAVPRAIGNWAGILTTGYAFYKFRGNPTIGNGITVGEGIVSLLSWEVGLGLTYIHTSIDYQNVMIQNQLQIINTVNDSNLSNWEKIGILNSTPSNPWGSCP